MGVLTDKTSESLGIFLMVAGRLSFLMLVHTQPPIVYQHYLNVPASYEPSGFCSRKGLGCTVRIHLSL